MSPHLKEGIKKNNFMINKYNNGLVSLIVWMNKPATDLSNHY